MIAEHRPGEDHPSPGNRPHARRRSLLHTLKAVGWGMLGIRGRGGHESDIANLNPLHLVVVALVCVAAFIGLLLLIVRLAVGGS
jgi:hypothetical protein